MKLARVAVACGIGLAGCVDHQSGVTGTQSIKVDLVDPIDTGDLQRRLPAGVHTIGVDFTAYDAEGNVDAGFERDVEVYAQFLGTLTPTPTLSTSSQTYSAPLATFHMTAGKASGLTVTLPPVFGPTVLWVEDGPKPKAGTLMIDPDYHPTYATGASPTLWYRDPFISDIQTPPDETALNAMSDSPLENKQVAVNTSRYGDAGRLVVTSVFAQGYTVADVKCADASGAPPCTASAYDQVEVFSFSAPTDQRGKLLQQGQLIDGFTGGISEFNGLTEIGFPATQASSDAVTPDRQPAAVKVDPATWFDTQRSPKGIMNFERNEAGPIEIDNATVCPLDGDFDRFKQWKIDASGSGCTGTPKIINVVTAGVINDLDPATLVGKTLPRVVGVLRPVFNIWIIFPRSAADLTLQ